MKKFVSILADLRKSHEKDKTIPAFLEYVRGETGFSVVPPEVGEDLANEKFEWGIFANGWIVFDDATQTVTEVMSLIPYVSIDVASPTRSTRDLGQFAINSGAIRFTDPCYNNDTWCKGSLPAVNGQWQAKLGFFRDDYDEKSLKDGMLIKAKAAEMLLELTYAIKVELEPMYQQLDKYVSSNRPTVIPFDQMELSDLTRPVVENIIQFSNEKIKPYSWRTAEESALATLLDVLSLMLGKSHRIPDRWNFRCAMLDLKREKGELTDEQVYEQGKEFLSTALVNMLEKSKKAYDAGHPRRVQFLHVKHESVLEFTAFDQNVWIENDKFNVGVDSGQAGFFDEAWYAEYGNEKDDNNPSEKWEQTYSMLGDLSLGESKYDPKTGEREEYNYAGVFEFGCNGLTAHGDGSAPLYYRTNDKGEVIEAVYHYDVACEEDEE